MALEKQPVRYKQDPIAGLVAFHAWRGTEEECKAKFPSLLGWLIGVTIDPVNLPYYEIQGQERTQDAEQWDVPGSMTTLPVTDHPNFWVMAGTLSDTLVQYYNGQKTYQEASDTLDQIDPVIMSGTNYDLAWGFFDLVKKGQKDYQTPSFCIRHTISLKSKSDLEIGMDGIGKIWSTAAVSDLITDAFQGIKDEIAAIPERFGSDPPAGYVWGWLKQAPHNQKTLGGATQWQEEWWLNYWPLILYSTYTP